MPSSNTISAAETEQLTRTRVGEAVADVSGAVLAVEDLRLHLDAEPVAQHLGDLETCSSGRCRG